MVAIFVRAMELLQIQEVKQLVIIVHQVVILNHFYGIHMIMKEILIGMIKEFIHILFVYCVYLVIMGLEKGKGVFLAQNQQGIAV